MTKFTAAGTGILVATLVAFGLGLSAQTNPAPKTAAAAPAGAPAPKPSMAVAHKAPPPAAATPQPDLTKQYCVGCHSEKGKAGGLSLVSFDPSKADQSAEVAEKVIHKLRLGMMPPPGARRPDAEALSQFATSLETKVDAAAALRPNPGRRPFQRLNRAEYARSVHDLLDLDVDVNAFLPPDTLSAGFDNIADVQTFSATLMEGYLRAASRISTLAVGDRNASPSEFTVKVPRTESQMRHVDGAPFGTRGGISVDYTFPADGDYTFRVMLHATPTGQLFGSVASRSEQIEVSINGERVALLDVDWKMTETDPNGMNLDTPRVHVKAGPQRVSAAFIQKFDGVVDDLVSPIDYTLADTEIGDNAGITILPHLRDFSITGPYKVTGVSDTPSRRKVFICRPTSPADESPCARKIVSSLAGEAYRRTPGNDDVESLMAFYGDARKGHDFEAGIEGGAPGDAREPAVRVPLRGARRRWPRPGRPTASATSISRRGCRSSSGAAPPDAELVTLATARHACTTAGRAREAGAPHAGRSARRGAVDALRRAVAAPAGPRQDPSRRAAVSRTSTSSSRSRYGARRSCSSTASCARIATCSTC